MRAEHVREELVGEPESRSVDPVVHHHQPASGTLFERMQRLQAAVCAACVSSVCEKRRTAAASSAESSPAKSGRLPISASP